ncbi:hypothetical protein LXL04_017562 [Taraxacum kok-saghyz]
MLPPTTTFVISRNVATCNPKSIWYEVESRQISYCMEELKDMWKFKTFKHSIMQHSTIFMLYFVHHLLSKWFLYFNRKRSSSKGDVKREGKNLRKSSRILLCHFVDRDLKMEEHQTELDGMKMRVCNSNSSSRNYFAPKQKSELWLVKPDLRTIKRLMMDSALPAEVSVSNPSIDLFVSLFDSCFKSSDLLSVSLNTSFNRSSNCCRTGKRTHKYLLQNRPRWGCGIVFSTGFTEVIVDFDLDEDAAAVQENGIHVEENGQKIRAIFGGNIRNGLWLYDCE